MLAASSPTGWQGARSRWALPANAQLHQLACVVQCSDAEYPRQTCTPSSSLLASRARSDRTVL
ncbi:hypothetical protein PN499_18320 [Kamptonema animale CS-326]|uniref:hypothetical protein n=1 Tax=Kamptonema animale TaxID=92934 RepID=UPI00232EC3E2|nr:hypothetical protein [Kamptonema animale]MDB9513152.1 hypothetical protein [Kamptonema animale CS-326]